MYAILRSNSNSDSTKASLPQPAEFPLSSKSQRAIVDRAKTICLFRGIERETRLSAVY